MNRRIVAGLAASLGAVALPARAQAQEAVITGRVINDRGGQPVSGATIAIPELGVGVTTNPAGTYTLTVPAARVRGQSVTLSARFIGFRQQRRTLTLAAGRQMQNFTLETDANRLSEVVVTGVATGTEQVRTPFTVQRLDSAQTPVVGTSALSQLQGKVAGANIVSASGRPGTAPSVLLRGPTSIDASGRSQEPLYIVDGAFIQGTIADINPNDIESIEVVKGAAAANLYGARAGAGVINITTKSGRTGGNRVKFGVRAEGGVGDIPRRFSIAKNSILAQDPSAQFYCSTAITNGSPCAQLVDLAAETRRVNEVALPNALLPINLRYDAGIGRAPGYGQLTGQFQAGQYNVTRNVQDQIVTANGFTNSNVDVRGQVGNTGIYGSVSNLTNQGAFRTLGGFVRNGARANIEQRFNNNLSLTLQTFYSATRSEGDNQDAAFEGAGNGFFRLTRTPSFVDLTQRDAQGRLYVRSNVLQQGSQNQNPLYDFENFRYSRKGQRFLGSSTLKFDPAEWVTLEGNFSYDRRGNDYTQIRDRGFRTTTVNPALNNGTLAQGASDDQSLNTSVTATLRRTFGDLRLSTVGRYIYEQQYETGLDLNGTQLVVPGLISADAIVDQDTRAFGSSRFRTTGMAFIGSLVADYKDRYLVQANLRQDGSSRFGAGNRWATFPGISGSWIVSREPWWKADNALSLFKLRTAYGQTGNRPRFTAQYATFTLGAGGQLNPAQLGNPNLRPEVRSEVEYGLDLEFYRRVGLNLTYADNNIRNQILQVPQSFGTGYISQWQNVGTLQNRSFEASLNVPVITRPNVSYSATLIFSRLRSRISKLNVEPFYVGNVNLQAAERIIRIAEGEYMGTIYGRDFVRRCDQLPGAFRGQCSGNAGDLNAAFRPNADGYIAWYGQGNGVNDGVTRNLWRAQLPAAQAPYGNIPGNGAQTLNWGMPILLRDSTTGFAAQVPLGQTLPRFQYGISQNFRYKRFNAYGLLDASIGGRIWNQGYAWSLGDFMTGAVDQAAQSVQTARPIGYYWRAGPGIGGFGGVGGLYDVLGPNRGTVEDASFAKLREVQLTYRVGRIANVGDWTFGVIGRNVFTWTKGYRGFDPEVGVAGGQLNNAALNGVDRFGFPNLRTVTLSVATAF